MAVALLTTYLPPYRAPLLALLAERHGVETLCYGGGERYLAPWFSDLDAQIRAAPFPARRVGLAEVLTVGRSYDTVIAPFAGGPLLPGAYLGARTFGRRFVLWASVWAQPRSLAHALTLPLVRHIYRDADAVIAYGEHVKRFVAAIRGRDEDIVVAPQSVERELFGRTVGADEIESFRAQHGLPDGPLVLYAGRLVPEKGVAVLLEAWRSARIGDTTLLMVGDGPLALAAARTPGTRVLGALPREKLPVAYAAAEIAVLASIPTPRFREPWGLVCNEAMHQGAPVIASDAVGAVAGGLVRDGESGLVVAAGDADALRDAIVRLLGDDALRARLQAGAREAVAPYSYDAMAAAFGRALALARERRR